MTVTVFASGSSGNCLLLSDGGAHLLIDAGISLRRITAALRGCRLTPGELCGVLITHEHNDHVSGLPMLCKHYGVPVLAPRTVANHLRWSAAGVDGFLREIEPLVPFSLGSLTVTAFPTPHDTDQSVGYRVEGSARFGLCTDSGCITEEMRRGLSGCDAVLVEANHDLTLLQDGAYPVYLKRRILSDRGHLSNERCAELVCELAARGTGCFVLGHLSRENNRPSLARATVETALRERQLPARVLVAPALGELQVEIAPCCV